MIKNSKIKMSLNNVLFFKAFILPLTFFLYGIWMLFEYHQALTVHGYLISVTEESLLHKGLYEGLITHLWPPLYPLLSTGVSWIVGNTLGGKLVSLIFATSFLLILPYITLNLSNRYLPGIILQLLLMVNPNFLKFSLYHFTNITNSFFGLLAIFFATNHFRNRSSRFNTNFLIFSILASLTDYGSLILIISFLATITIVETKTNQLRYIFWFCIIYSPWIIYTFITEKGFFSSVLSLPIIIANRMVLTDQINVSDYTYLAYDLNVFQSFTYILKNYNIDLVDFFIQNCRQAIKLFFINFPLLNIFSILIIIGLGYIIINFDTETFFILLILSLFFLKAIIFGSVELAYPIHILIYLALLGTISILEFKQQSFIQRYWLHYLFLMMIAVGLIFYQLPKNIMAIRYSTNFKFFTEKNFFKWKKLKKFDNLNKNSANITMMSDLESSGVVYQLGYKPILAGLSSGSPKSFLCYRDLKPLQTKLLKTLNYPMNQKLSQYVPPDFILLTKNLAVSISEVPNIQFREIQNYLEEAEHWNFEGLPKLYKVKKSHLNCLH